jgi:transketolase
VLSEIRSAAPQWADRDRFVLSAGHGSMLIYALLHLTGYARPTIEDIRNFRQLHSPCAGHPENIELPGVECTTGPLGQGLAMAVGMAMAERHLNAGFGDELVDHKTWVIAGDGCLMEGINHEAIGLAGHLKLGRLNVLWDDNRITIDGDVTMSSSEDIKARYAATGWHVAECDGHDFADIAARSRSRRRSAPVARRLQDDDRQGRAQQAGHAQRARLAAGGGRDRRGARRAGLERRRSKFPPMFWRVAPLESAEAAARAEWEARLAASAQKGRVRAPHGRRAGRRR